ncbi:hypothetical protein HF072_07275 [Bacillus sp. RO3]|nr:hypothetical protein [Bacillus sp. RO3]
MIDIRFLLPTGRSITLNNEGKIAKVWLEGQEKTHKVIEHTYDAVIFKSLNGNRVREIKKLDVNYLTPNQHGGWRSNVLHFRGSKG